MYLTDPIAISSLGDLLGISVGLSVLSAFYKSARDVLLTSAYPTLWRAIRDGVRHDDVGSIPVGEQQVSLVEPERMLKESGRQATSWSIVLLFLVLYASVLIVEPLHLPRWIAWMVPLLPVPIMYGFLRRPRNKRILADVNEQLIRHRDTTRRQAFDGFDAARRP